MYDILIKHGQIVDGTGAPAFYGDIAVKDGLIARIAPEIDAEAKQVIDAAGLQVTPASSTPTATATPPFTTAATATTTWSRASPPRSPASAAPAWLPILTSWSASTG